MKCFYCGAATEIKDSRPYKTYMVRRKHLCFNGHEFQTYEVFAVNLDKRTLADTQRGISARQKAHARKAFISKRPEMSATALAKELNITEARVRQIRQEQGYATRKYVLQASVTDARARE